MQRCSVWLRRALRLEWHGVTLGLYGKRRLLHGGPRARWIGRVAYRGGWWLHGASWPEAGARLRALEDEINADR